MITYAVCWLAWSGAARSIRGFWHKRATKAIRRNLQKGNPDGGEVTEPGCCLSDHARKEAERRGSLLSVVQSVMDFPQQIIEAYNNPPYAQP